MAYSVFNDSKQYSGPLGFVTPSPPVIAGSLAGWGGGGVGLSEDASKDRTDDLGYTGALEQRGFLSTQGALKIAPLDYLLLLL